MPACHRCEPAKDARLTELLAGSGGTFRSGRPSDRKVPAASQHVPKAGRAMLRLDLTGLI
jgi:hypothetical protein